MKKIVVLKCSPRKNGNSDILADAFIRGAKESNHEVVEFEVGRMRINPCTACEMCYTTDKPCVIDDDMQKIYPKFLEADILVIAAPIYYFDLPAQYKLFIDRIYACDIKQKVAEGKEFVFLATAGDTSEKIFKTASTVITQTYKDWFKWKDSGRVLVENVNDKGAITGNLKLEEAYKLGLAI